MVLFVFLLNLALTLNQKRMNTNTLAIKALVRVGLLMLTLTMGGAAMAQAPTYNPYFKHYGVKVGHWTDSLKWTTVVPVTQFGAVADDSQDDYTAIQRGIDSLHSRGGGVLYFPSGMYESSETLIMKSGVVLRGDTLPSGQDDPKQASYNPPSKLWFPKYVFDTLANNGAGVDRNTAFKLIEGAKDCSNSGVIDLDINRAVIKYQPEWVVKGAPHVNLQPGTPNRNILVMGVRSNNAALEDPAVPTAQQKPWQLFIWRFTSNIDVNVTANCIIARNRLNDGVPVDNFMMENYLIEFRGTGGWRPLSLAQDPLFDYNAHYGIALNRKKTYRNTTTGRWAIDGYPAWSSPEQEPTLFSPGNQILDNWMYKTNRVAIIAAGNGLVIRGNEMYDDSTKPNRTNFIGVTGRLTPQGATTFENRGLDFSGWNVVIENNIVECFRHRAGGYLSTDGEGILLQECCGGTQVNDYVIRNNFMKRGNYIGIYKMRDINNVLIENNDLGSGPVWVWANTNGAQYYLNSTVVRNNTNVSGVSMNGSLGGTTCYVEDNQGTGSGGINTPCHTVVDRNTGFTGVTYNTGGGVPCAGSTDYPQAAIVGPSTDSAFCASAPTPVLIKAKVTNSDHLTATIDIISGSTTIATGLVPDPVDSTARFMATIPAVNGTYPFTAVVRNNSNFAFSRVRTFTVNCVVTSLDNAVTKPAQWTVYPNPAGAQAFVHSSEITSGMVTVELLDMAGRLQYKSSQMPTDMGFTHNVDTRSLAPGIYQVILHNAGAKQVKRLVIQ